MGPICAYSAYNLATIDTFRLFEEAEFITPANIPPSVGLIQAIRDLTSDRYHALLLPLHRSSPWLYCGCSRSSR